jgi:chaperonin cofactor prefoldin
MNAEDKVQIEELKTHVKVIAEGHCALAERLDRVEKICGGFEQLEIRVVVLGKRVEQLEHRAQAIENEIAVHDHRLGRVEARFAPGGRPPNA